MSNGVTVSDEIIAICTALYTKAQKNQQLLNWEIDSDNSNPRQDELFFVSFHSSSYWGSTASTQ